YKYLQILVSTDSDLISKRNLKSPINSLFIFSNCTNLSINPRLMGSFRLIVPKSLSASPASAASTSIQSSTRSLHNVRTCSASCSCTSLARSLETRSTQALLNRDAKVARKMYACIDCVDFIIDGQVSR